MHVTHLLWLAELCPRKMERVNGVAPSSRPWHSRILLLNHTRENGVPSRIFTDNLTLRTRPLYVLSYGDNESNIPIGLNSNNGTRVR